MVILFRGGLLKLRDSMIVTQTKTERWWKLAHFRFYFITPKPWGFMIQFDLRIFLVKNDQLVSEIPKTKGMIRVMHPKENRYLTIICLRWVGSTTKVETVLCQCLGRNFQVDKMVMISMCNCCWVPPYFLSYRTATVFGRVGKGIVVTPILGAWTTSFIEGRAGDLPQHVFFIQGTSF